MDHRRIKSGVPLNDKVTLNRQKQACNAQNVEHRNQVPAVKYLCSLSGGCSGTHVVLPGLSRVGLLLDGNIVRLIRDAFVYASQSHVGIDRAGVMKYTGAAPTLTTCNRRCFMLLLVIRKGCCRFCIFVELPPLLHVRGK